jgi:hypothetical protein
VVAVSFSSGARLFAGQDGAGAEAHSAGSSPGPVLDYVSLVTAGQDAQGEAGDPVIPDEILGRLNLGGVDHAFGQFRHTRDPPFMLTLFFGFGRARPWTHCGSKRAGVAARAYENQSVGRPARSQRSH